MGLIAHEIVNDKWFFKVETTVTNAYTAKRDATVECTVGGTNSSPTVDAFSSY